MVRIIKQGEYTTTIYKLIADQEYSQAATILERCCIVKIFESKKYFQPIFFQILKNLIKKFSTVEIQPIYLGHLFL